MAGIIEQGEKRILQHNLGTAEHNNITVSTANYTTTSINKRLQISNDTMTGIPTTPDVPIENNSNTVINTKHVQAVIDGAFDNGSSMLRDVFTGVVYVPSGTNATIQIQTHHGLGVGPNVKVQWAPDDIETFTTDGAILTHTYLTPGYHEFEVYGFGNDTSSIQIGTEATIMISNFGSEVSRIFFGRDGSTIESCPNLIEVPKRLPKQIRSVRFEKCTNFNSANVIEWDTSNLDSMQYMFAEASNFNQPIGHWLTTNVTDMIGTFSQASSFNQMLYWDTTNVTSMSAMFLGATNYNQPINFDTPQVTDVSMMFSHATKFNSTITLSNTLNITTMRSMFHGASIFNQPLTFNTANVTDMSYMFNVAAKFNQPIQFNASKLISILGMFANATSFNSNVILTDMNKIENFKLAFSNANKFNRDLSHWDVSGATNMDNMFENATVFNQDLSQWCVRNIKTKPVRFDDGTPAWVKPNRQPIWGWCPGDELPYKDPIILQVNTTQNKNNTISIVLSNSRPGEVKFDFGDGIVKDATSDSVMRHTYADTNSTYTIKIYTKDSSHHLSVVDQSSTDGVSLTHVNAWGTGRIDGISFSGCRKLIHVPVEFPTSITSLAWTFQNCVSFNSSNVSNWDTSNVTNMVSVFKGCANFNQSLNWNTSKVTNMQDMFSGATSFNGDVNFSDTSRVTNMQSMFYEASNFNKPVEFNTSNVTIMSGMFIRASRFNRPLNWNTAKVTTMQALFNGATSFNGDVNFADTSRVTNMQSMFGECHVFNRPVNFNTSNVTTMQSMFQGAHAFNQPLNFNTSNVTNMNSMFYNAPLFNRALNFNTSKVSDMQYMFRDARAFNQNISHWCVPLIGSKPYDFDTNTPAWNKPYRQPQWGTCPAGVASPPPPPPPEPSGTQFSLNAPAFYWRVYKPNSNPEYFSSIAVVWNNEVVYSRSGDFSSFSSMTSTFSGFGGTGTSYRRGALVSTQESGGRPSFGDSNGSSPNITYYYQVIK